MKALDLFCCAGGAATGLHRAGFEITGVDISPQPNYPFEFLQGDALAADLSGFDFVWASPPCQSHSTLKHRTGKDYECFISRTREKLQAWGGPWIIENVVGAPLIDPVRLCGSAFGLGVRRHRIFESNAPPSQVRSAVTNFNPNQLMSAEQAPGDSARAWTVKAATAGNP